MAASRPGRSAELPSEVAGVVRLTIRAFGRELLAVSLDRSAATAECTRPHRDPPGFVGGASLRADLGPNRWRTTTTTKEDHRG